MRTSLFTRLPLRYSVPLAVTILAIVLGVSSLTITLSLAMRQLHVLAGRSTQTATTALQQSVEYLLRASGPEQVRELVAQKGADPTVVMAFLADADGIVIAATDRNAVGRPGIELLRSLRSIDPEFEPGSRLVAQEPRVTPGGTLMTITRPIHLTDTDARVGMLVLVRDLSGYLRVIRGEMYRGHLLFAVLAALSALIIAALMHLVLKRRGLQLITAAAQFADGDASARAQLSGNDELAAVGRAFDQMAERVATARQALADSEADFRRMTDAAPVMMWVVGLDGHARYFNEAWLRFRGRSLSEELGTGWMEAIPPEDRAKDMAIYAELIAQPVPQFDDHRLIRHDGQIRDIETHTVPLRDSAGNLQAFIGAGTDVTERKQAQTALRESREQLAEILGTAMDAVITVDERFDIMLFNRAAGAMFQRSPEEMLGRPFELLLPERLRARHRDYLRQSGNADINLRAAEIPDLNGLRANGEEFPIEASISRAHIGGRKFHTVILRDVSERVSAERHRVQLEEQLQQSQKMEALGALAGGIAHDFNNIMAAILGNADLARGDLLPEHPAVASLNEISAATRRGKEMVSRLLAFSRPHAAQRKPLLLQATVEEALRLLRATLSAGVQIEFTAAGDIPKIEADAAQIHQVLLNLVTNAWHSMDNGRGRIDVHLSSTLVDSTLSQRHPDLQPGAYVRLTVRDDGRGMDAAVLARIFEPFFTTKRPGEGTGLGLAMVHGIMRSHGGAVLVDSAPGRGSAFHLYFPALAAEIAVPAAPVAVPDPVRTGAGEHVLYVDDDEALVFLAQRALQRLGYRVTGVLQATEAIAIFRANPGAFDLVVTDYNMPGMSGLELARELLRIRPDAAVILASGYVRVEDEKQAEALGVKAVLLKPSSVDEVAALIARHLHAKPTAATPTNAK